MNYNEACNKLKENKDEVIKALKLIRNVCSSTSCCGNCMFHSNSNGCYFFTRPYILYLDQIDNSIDSYEIKTK